MSILQIKESETKIFVSVHEEIYWEFSNWTSISRIKDVFHDKDNITAWESCWTKGSPTYKLTTIDEWHSADKIVGIQLATKRCERTLFVESMYMNHPLGLYSWKFLIFIL